MRLWMVLITDAFFARLGSVEREATSPIGAFPLAGLEAPTVVYRYQLRPSE